MYNTKKFSLNNDPGDVNDEAEAPVAAGPIGGEPAAELEEA